MTTPLRVLAHESGDGPWNMALDEALLDSVAADPSRAVLRTYSWSVPTLSLGYFQRIAEAEADPRWRSVPIVRRPTGGGALWHDREVTYAVVVPATHPSARPSSALYRAIHEAIAGHLRSIGVGARRRGEDGTVLETTGRPFLCFTDRDPDDIVLDGSKLVGSAQRRRSGAVLQHGSILLGRSPTTPELAGLGDLSTIPSDPTTWIETIEAILPPALGLRPLADEVDPDERLKAEVLRREVYGSRSWTGRR